MATPREKFQSLLRELFQFDRANLDFGIYRIMIIPIQASIRVDVATELSHLRDTVKWATRLSPKK
jgi:hypothetical protein